MKAKFELKPCPFCGGEAVLIKDISGRRAWHVCCNSEKCFMGMGLPIWSKSESEAAKAWNKRADTKTEKHGSWSEKQVAYKDSFGDFHFGFKCSACGAIINKSNYCGNCGAKMDIDTGNYYTPKDGGAE